MDLGLKDRIAVVAASSKGLGKAVALGLAAEGAKLGHLRGAARRNCAGPRPRSQLKFWLKRWM